MREYVEETGTVRACPESLVITPTGEMYGWFESEPYHGWLYLGQYNAQAVERMLAAASRREPVYGNKPC